MADRAARHLAADARDDLLKRLAVLPRPDRADVGTDQLDPVPGQGACLVQRNGGIERGLPAERGKKRVGSLGRDHLLKHLERDRLDVGGVGELGVGHDRRGIGVDQADPDPLMAEHPAGLRARVIELAGLADHDRARADHQHRVQVSAPRHRASSKNPDQSSGALHYLAELAEQTGRVVRARRGLRVELHGERRGLNQPQSLNHAVVKVHVRDFGGAEFGLETRGTVSVARVGHVRPAVVWLGHGEAMVVAGDLDPPGAQVAYRLVDAAMAEPQLVGAKPERTTEHLAAHADAENRDARGEHFAHRLDRVAARRRVTRPVGVENAVRAAGQNLVRCAGRGQHVHLAAEPGHRERRSGLDAKIDSGHPEPYRPATGRPDHVWLGRGHLTCQIRPRHLRAGTNAPDELDRVGRRRADRRAHRAAFAQVQGQRPGPCDRDPGDPGRPQLVVERAGSPPARCDRAEIADHETRDPDPPRFVVLVIDSGVADVRRRHRHDLTAVRRIGQRFLVAGHRRAEHRLAESLAARPEPRAAENAAVFEHEQGGSAHLASLPLSTVGRPRRNVATTRPGSLRPANAVLRLRETCALGSTGAIGSGSYSTRLAGEPGAIGQPCRWSPRPTAGAPIRPNSAGLTDIRSAIPDQSSRPVLTMASCTTRSAVSRPVMPNEACDHSVSLDSAGCGAWSVATQSIVPSARAARRAATSAAVRSGGFTLYTGSYPTARSSVSKRWWGVTSAVTCQPLDFAHLMISTDPAVEVWQMWTAEPTCAASRQSRATIASSATAGQPVRPSLALISPSLTCAPAVSLGSWACCAITPPNARTYSRARRISTASCTHRPSSEKTRTRAAESAMAPSSASRLPSRPAVTAPTGCTSQRPASRPSRQTCSTTPAVSATGSVLAIACTQVYPPWAAAMLPVRTVSASSRPGSL